MHMKPPAEKHPIPKSKIHFSHKHEKLYEPMEWNEFFDEKVMFNESTPVYINGSKGAVLFCLHGLGLSAMSFAVLAWELKDYLTLVTFDWKGHGGSLLPNDGDFSQ